VRDRCERGALVEVGRGVAEKQGSEHPRDDPASHRPEFDGDVILGKVRVGLPGGHLRLGQDVDPQGSIAGEALGDIPEGLAILLILGSCLSDHQLVLGDHLLTECLGHRLA
jgi:hypothetical protein